MREARRAAAVPATCARGRGAAEPAGVVRHLGGGGSGVQGQPELTEWVPSQLALSKSVFQEDPSEVFELERWLRRGLFTPAAGDPRRSCSISLTCAYPHDDLKLKQVLKEIIL